MALLLGGDDASTSLGNELDESRNESSQGDSIGEYRKSQKIQKIRVKEGASEGGELETGHFYIL